MEIDIDKGYDLCFGELNSNPTEGRTLLKDCGEGGRSDAYYYMGLSYELEGSFDAADNAYLAAKKPDGRVYLLAAYRSAMLHWKKRVSKPDKDYYLRAIRQLASDEHWPSVARYTRERLKGSYGFSGFLSGLFAFVPNFVRIVRAVHDDPEQETIQLRKS